MTSGVALRGAAIGLVAALAGLAAATLADLGPSTGLLLGLAVACLAAAGGYLSLSRSARAVHAVRLAADRVAEGALEQQVVDAPGPVAELTHAFNAMSRRVKELVEGVAAEEARLQAALAASTDALVAVAPDATVRFLNPAAARLLATGESDFSGRPFIQLARDHELDALVREALTPGNVPTPRVVTFGPQRVPLRAVAVPIVDGGGWAALLMLTDLTEVQRFDQARRDFVSNVSHELRTPLASIRALVETLQDGHAGGPETEAEFLRRIRQQTDRLTSLVNELLDLSRIESGAIILHPEPLRLGEIVAEAAGLLSTAALANGVTLRCPPAASGPLEADRAALLRIVTNLLDNAIKYSPHGGLIEIDAGDDGDVAWLSVRDQGEGIPPQDAARVFERFFKGDSARATAGSGLGLAIVKHLVRAHGGTVAVVSEPGHGATFTVRLPKEFAPRRA